MANILNTDFSYTYPGKVSTEVFYKPSVQCPDITKLFRVKTDVRSKERLTLVGVLSNIVKAYSSCTRASTSASTMSLSDRVLQTEELEIYLEECKDVFEETIFEYASRTGIDKNDLTGTDIDKIIQTLVLDAMWRDNFRILSFGDTDSPDSNYSMLNGLWSKLIAGVNTAYDVTRIGGALGSAVLNDSGSEAKEILKDLFEQAPIVLKQVPIEKKKFYVTGTIFEGYLRYLQGLTSTEGAFKLQQDGTIALKFNGIDVIPFYAWDQHLEADNPLGASVRHLALYTTPENHVVGLEKASDSNKVSAWYERKDRKYYIEGQYKMGYQFIHEDLQAISY